MVESSGHPTEPSPRLPREEVRRRLLTAAAALFAEHGYDDTRLEDVAKAAGFTKGAVYSNFGGKQELFGAILTERAEAERTAVLGGVQAAENADAAIRQAAHHVAQRITGDTERGRLGLEVAARATRDERVRDVVAPMRRSQRQAAAESIAEAAERTGSRLAAPPELAGLIVHCLTNGLSMEHLADPEAIDADTVEQALTAVLALLVEHSPED
jgi:AcrR family transcriptional regulator